MVSGNGKDAEGTAKDILAFILTGEFEGEAYELDKEQVKRTLSIINQLAEGRMFAAAEIPPVDLQKISGPQPFKSYTDRNPNLN